MGTALVIGWLELAVAVTVQISVIIAIFWRQSILINSMKKDQEQFRIELTALKTDVEAGKLRENLFAQKLDRATLLLEMIYKKVYETDAPR